MIKSMTGYGQASMTFNNKNIKIEIKSLNSKNLELNLRLPSLYRSKELELRSEISSIAERGKVELFLNIERQEEEHVPTINTEVITKYIDQLKAIPGQYDPNNLLAIAMQLPNVLDAPGESVDEAEWTAIRNCLKSALTDFDQCRKEEGEILEKDFTLRIGLIRDFLKQIEPFESRRTAIIREKLLNMITDMVGLDNVDQNRFEQELIFYCEKLDITEEKVRLVKHLNYLLETLSAETSQGKKLGFITQEIGREINTIGSKANDANMQRLVVGMKDELEKIKEQLLNIL